MCSCTATKYAEVSVKNSEFRKKTLIYFAFCWILRYCEITVRFDCVRFTGAVLCAVRCVVSFLVTVSATHHRCNRSVARIIQVRCLVVSPALTAAVSIAIYASQPPNEWYKLAEHCLLNNFSYEIHRMTASLASWNALGALTQAFFKHRIK